MRRLLFLAVCFFMTTVLFAESVSKEQARQIASQFLQSRVAVNGKRAASISDLNLAARVSDLYVFNVTDGRGYVIVSNDDCAETVLGYADSSFDPQNIPDNMRAWLQGYADEIAWAEKHNIQKTSASSVKRVSSVKSVIGPLLESKWNQEEPYNNLCPSSCVTGCVATAMAQVMYYNKWPLANISKAIPAYDKDFSNSAVRQPLTSDLPVIAFDWENMMPTYPAAGTSEEVAAKNLAVAQLMYYCGCSVRMDYGSSSSAATSVAVDALKDYFDYSSTTVSKNRSYYSYTNWIELLYHELSEGRVVLYSGSSTGGGHAFVCDGYQTEDYFHINWGWGGSSDGHFKLSALNPSDQGAGGSSSTDGFNYMQGAIVGIQKNGGTGTVLDLEQTPDITVNSIELTPSTITLGESVDVKFNVTNNGTKEYDGDIYVYVYGKGANVGKNFVIPAGETKDCVITYTPRGFTGTASIMAAFPANIGGSYYIASSSFENLTVNAGEGASTNVDLTLSVIAENAENESSSYNLYGNYFNAKVRVTNSTENNYSGTLYWQILEGDFYDSFQLETVTIAVPKNSYIDVPLPAKFLDWANDSYKLYTSYNKNGNLTSEIFHWFNLKPAIMTYQADGTVSITKPSGTSLDVSSSDVLAVDVTGTGITSVTPNSQKNAVYIYSGTKPSGLDGKNVIKYNGTDYTAETITLTDDNDFYSPVDFTAFKIEFTYTFTNAADGSNGWNTIMLPFDVDEVTADDTAIDWFHSGSDTGKNFWLKEFASDDVNTVNFNYVSGGKITANIPYIIAFPGDKWGAAWDLSGKTIKFIGNNTLVYKGSTLSTITGVNYRFRGSTVQDDVANIYCINATGSSFELKTTGGSAPFRAYFKPGIFDSSVTSLSIGSGDGGATGINGIQHDTMDKGVYYNLNGQRVAQPTKGLYIKNGKKYIVK